MMRNNNTMIAKNLYRAAGKNRNIRYTWGEGDNLYIRLKDHKKMNLWAAVMLHEVVRIQLLPHEIYRIVLAENAMNTATKLMEIAA